MGKKLCEDLGLKNTFLLGARSQDQLAEMYTVASLGCFPSFKEPFGLVFVECMACGTPVIGANSGGPRDFVNESVGTLIPDELLSVPSTDKLVNDLFVAVCKALDEDWKKT